MIRDIVIVVGYLMISFFTGERVPVRPSYLGKLSTVLQLACVIAVLARVGNYWPVYFNALLIVDGRRHRRVVRALHVSRTGVADDRASREMFE